MSRVSKERTEAYDNIAAGSAITSRERTINGALPPNQTTYGNIENITVAVDYGQENDPAATDRLQGERVGGP